MSGEIYYHGGKRGLGVGDYLVPSPPHVTDGCPICVARAEGRALTVGEYRRFLAAHSDAQAAGGVTRSTEDFFPTWTVPRARVIAVVRRKVRLRERERNRISRRWAEAEAVA